MKRNTLEYRFNLSYERHHPTSEHLPVLRAFAAECASVTEIGLAKMDSSWGLLQGLSESSSPERTYLGIDCVSPPIGILNQAKILAEQAKISFTFLNANDLYIERLDPIDLLFIDGLHNYCHLLYELERFSSQVGKYIVMHDTDEPWGNRDERASTEDYAKYFPEIPVGVIDWSKKGLKAAIVAFLKRHREWEFYEHRPNSNGLTTLRRGSTK